MGAIEYNPSTAVDYIPDNKSLNKFVVTSFEQGIINKIYGLLPESSKYIYLVKNLQKNKVIDKNEGEIDIYMNFAFEFDNYDTYKNFAANFDNLSTEQAVDECSKFIVPDRSVGTYALKVKATEFNSFVEKMSKSVNGGNNDKTIYIEVVPSKPQEEKLQNIFHYEFENLGNKKYCYPVKKNASMRAPQTKTSMNQNQSKTNPKLIAAVAAAVIIVLVILWLMLR